MLMKTYEALIRSKLNYGSRVCNLVTKPNIVKLIEPIQNLALRLATRKLPYKPKADVL